MPRPRVPQDLRSDPSTLARFLADRERLAVDVLAEVRGRRTLFRRSQVEAILSGSFREKGPRPPCGPGLTGAVPSTPGTRGGPRGRRGRRSIPRFFSPSRGALLSVQARRDGWESRERPYRSGSRRGSLEALRPPLEERDLRIVERPGVETDQDRALGALGHLA